MGNTKHIKFEYYNVVCRMDGEPEDTPDTQFDFTIWINEAHSKSLEQRNMIHYSDTIRIEDINYLNNGLWYLNFNKLRARNIPNKAKLNATAQPLDLNEDEYIGEDISALYDENLHVLMLQRNKNCVGVSGIETYLNALQDKVKYQIFLRPIIRKDIVEKLRNPKEYRSFTIRFSDLSKLNSSVSEGGSIRKAFDAFSVYEPETAEIKVSMGRTRRKSLNAETVKEALSDIERNKDNIQRAEVSIKTDDDTAVEVIDLFSDKLHDIMDIKVEDRLTINHALIMARMVEQYNASREKLLRAIS